MPARAASPSLTQRTYSCLRADILGGRFAPGQRLRPSELAAANGVSLNVVREALNRLAGERLVRASPQQGFAVIATTPTDLADLTDVRGLVEAEALRRSIERGDLAWESEVVAAHHRLVNTPMAAAEDPDVLSDDWARAHSAFHAATMSGCGSARLIDMAAGLGECAALYRHWSHRYDGGRRDVAGEHRAIFDATLAREPDLACRLHLDHIQRTADIVIAAIAADAASLDAASLDDASGDTATA